MKRNIPWKMNQSCICLLQDSNHWLLSCEVIFKGHFIRCELSQSMALWYLSYCLWIVIVICLNWYSDKHPMILSCRLEIFLFAPWWNWPYTLVGDLQIDLIGQWTLYFITCGTLHHICWKMDQNPALLCHPTLHSIVCVAWWHKMLSDTNIMVGGNL